MIAAELMTPNPRTVRANASVRTALEILWANDVRHLPVLDAEGGLVGILSDRDVGTLVKTFDGGAEAFGARKVGDLMSGDVVYVDEETDLTEVIETLLEQRIGAVPVVDLDGELSGIISYVDILRNYAGELSAAVTKVSAKKKAATSKNKKKKSAGRKSVKRRSR